MFYTSTCSNDRDCSLGNRFCDYFLDMGMAFYNNCDFVVTYQLDFESSFANVLPRFVPFNADIAVELHRFTEKDYVIEGILHCCAWEMHNDAHIHFWKTMRPLVRNILQESVCKLGLCRQISYPIIHFRCSDVPFIRHSSYHFQRYAYFINEIQELRSQGIDCSSVYLMTNHTHCTSQHMSELGNKYTQHLFDFLQKKLQNVGTSIIKVSSNSYMSDWSAMFCAPAVISTGSSFSFFAGYFGGPDNFSPSTFRMEHNLISAVSALWLKNEYSVDHSNVVDYDNIDDVCLLLEN